MDEVYQERFMKFVDVSGECWSWTGSKDKAGYGQFNFDGKQWLAHRVMYLHCFGSLTPGLDICHTCRNRCVNPEHLEEKTTKENMADKLRDGTDNRGEKNCRSKLTTEQVLEIRRLSTKFKQTKIARDFGVSRQLIHKIISRKVWTHI